MRLDPTNGVTCASCMGENDNCPECEGAGWVYPTHEYEPSDDRLEEE